MTDVTILYVANSAEIGGGNRSLLTLWDGLASRGVNPIVVSPAVGPLVRECQGLGITCHIINDPGPSWQQPVDSWSRMTRWRGLIEEYRVSLIHTNGSSGARAVGWASWTLGLPLVCHCRFPEKRAFVKWNYRFVKKPDVMIFNSQGLHREMGPVYADVCPRTRQLVVSNAVDLDRFRPRPKSPGDPLRVGIVANLLRVKGHVDFGEMARALIDRGWDSAEFWVIGGELEPGYQVELQQLAASLKVSGRVRFLGFRDDIEELISALDVLVCASHVEPFGRCLIEAMACERPLVATMVGGIPEVVEDGVSGFLVPPGDPRSLADAVERLLRDDHLRRKMGCSGRKRVEQLFSKEAHANRIYEIYRELIDQTETRRARGGLASLFSTNWRGRGNALETPEVDRAIEAKRE